jgi:hypothetical protein
VISICLTVLTLFVTGFKTRREETIFGTLGLIEVLWLSKHDEKFLAASTAIEHVDNPTSTVLRTEVAAAASLNRCGGRQASKMDGSVALN